MYSIIKCSQGKVQHMPDEYKWNEYILRHSLQTHLRRSIDVHTLCDTLMDGEIMVQTYWGNYLFESEDRTSPWLPQCQVRHTPLAQIKLVLDFSSKLCLWKMMRTWPTATTAKISHLWPIHHLEAALQCERHAGVMVAYCDRHLIQAHYCTGSVSRYI